MSFFRSAFRSKNLLAPVPTARATRSVSSAPCCFFLVAWAAFSIANRLCWRLLPKLTADEREVILDLADIVGGPRASMVHAELESIDG